MVEGPVVAVRGEAVREVPPEIARFTVVVAARDRDREAVLTRLAERAEATRELIDRYGSAVERRETGGLQVWPEPKRSGERVSAYHGRVTTTVTVVDFTALGELMLRLADQDQVTVSGPWWDLRPTSPVHRQARRAAIDEALTRAEEYADALGSRVTELVELADTGMADRPMTANASYEVLAAGGPPRLELDPQPQTVRAVVEARFLISAPARLATPRD